MFIFSFNIIFATFQNKNDVPAIFKMLHLLYFHTVVNLFSTVKVKKKLTS